MPIMGEEAGMGTCVLDVQAFRRELGCYRCQVGRAVGKSNRPSRSEATGNEKVLLDFPSRDLLFTFKKPLRGTVGYG